MNRIFRVIWSQATQSWVAVSELTKAHKKQSSTHQFASTQAVDSLPIFFKLSALTFALLIASNMAYAAEAQLNASVAITKQDKNNFALITSGESSADTRSGTTKLTNVIYIGNGKTPAIGDEDVLIGNDMTNTNTGLAGNTLIGNRVRSGGGKDDSLSTAVGYAAQVAGPAVAMGVGARADIGDATGWNAVANGGVAIGDFAMIGGNQNGGTAVGAIAQADQGNSVAIGALSGASRLYGDRDLAAENDTKLTSKGKDWDIRESGIVSTDAQTPRTNGNYSGGTQNNLTSVGYKAAARGDDSVAIGSGATTSRVIRSPIAGKETESGQFNTRKADGEVAIGNAATAIKDNRLRSVIVLLQEDILNEIR